MKQLLFLLLFPCLALAQYTGNAGQKITLGEQTTADGLVYRGRTSDTVNLLTNKLDTSVYIVLDTGTRAMWYYRASTTPKWTRLVDSLNNLQGTLSVAKGGTGSATQNFVDLTTTQSVNGVKTFLDTIIVNKGIRFPATQSASTNINTLDDYEEGSFTANYSTTDIAFSSISHDITSGTYTKIGNLVYVSIAIRTSALTIGSASGLVAISLPFASKTGLDGFSGSVSFAASFNVNHPITCNVSGSLLLLQYRSTSNGSGNFLEPVDLATGVSKNYAYITTSYIAN